MAPVSSTVLIEGESGTGKELVARAIKLLSNRRNKPFIAVNVGALPETLLESELFGHEKGAFTGAAERRLGRFELADSGTLFLDEIGEIPPATQVKLLRVLEEREFMRVGGVSPISVDVRVIAATNQPLRELVEDGRFRADLFYRLNVLRIYLPPLRERPEDIPDLVRHFLARASEEGLPPKRLDPEAMDRLKRYRWPGNVRELENLVRRLAALYAEETIGLDVIESELIATAPEPSAPEAGEPDSIVSAVERHLRRYFAAHGDRLPPPGLYDRIVQEVERPLLELSLSATRGNQVRAAHLLGLNRNTLRKKIRDLDIQVVRGLK
jgi:two-component system nitrogen regulation response regulator GlnG